MIQDIPLEKIRPGPNDRKSFEIAGDDGLAALATSITANGFFGAIVVRPMPDGSYEIVGGERRTRAHWLIALCRWIECVNGRRDTLPALTTIRADVQQLDDNAARLIMLLENVQRKDLNPMEESAAYARLQADNGMSVSEMSRVTGRSETLIKSRLALAELLPAAQDALKQGTFPVSWAEKMRGLTREYQFVAWSAYGAGKCKNAVEFGDLCGQLRAKQDTAQASMFDLALFSGKPIDQALDDLGVETQERKTRREIEAELEAARTAAEALRKEREQARAIARKLKKERDQLMKAVDAMRAAMAAMMPAGQFERLMQPVQTR